jgi:protein TonB
MHPSRAACQRIAVVAALVLHVCAVIPILAWQPGKPDALATQPLLVQWVSRSPPEPPKPVPPIPEALPEAKPAPRTVAPNVVPVKPPPATTAIETAPPAQTAAVPDPQPSEPTAATRSESAAAPSSGVPQPAPAPAPIAPPSFNADYLHNPAPRYPATSRRLGESGRVVLRVLVSAGGMAERVELRHSSGSRRLDDAALETVQRWKFVPARQGDTPVAAWVLVPIVFTLEG